MALFIAPRTLPGKPIPAYAVLNLHTHSNPTRLTSRGSNKCRSDGLYCLYPPQGSEDRDNGPKASDYNDVSKVILTAANVHQCLISTVDGFPDLVEELEFVASSRSRANEDAGMERPLVLTPDIGRSIKQCGSQTRGEAKIKITAMVESLYQFASGHGRKIVIDNWAQAEDLKHEKGFTYKVFEDGVRTLDEHSLSPPLRRHANCP